MNYGKVVRLNSTTIDNRSMSEIVIETRGGAEVSTGLRPSSELKPYSWRVGDFVEYIETNGVVESLVAKKELPSSWVPLSKIDKPTPTNGITKHYIWGVMILVLAFGYWISKGTPNPALFFSSEIAKRECLRLANENRGSIMIIRDSEIRANNTWIRDGKLVVQLTQRDGSSVRQIMCLYGNGMVQIPSLLEQGRWR